MLKNFFSGFILMAENGMFLIEIAIFRLKECANGFDSIKLGMGCGEVGIEQGLVMVGL